MNWVMWVNYNIDHQAYLGMLSRTIFSPIRGEVYFSKLISLDIYLEEIKTLRFFEPHTHRKTKLTWDPKELDGLYMFLPFPSGLFFSGSKVKVFQGKKPPQPQQQRKFHQTAAPWIDGLWFDRSRHFCNLLQGFVMTTKSRGLLVGKSKSGLSHHWR